MNTKIFLINVAACLAVCYASSAWQPFPVAEGVGGAGNQSSIEFDRLLVSTEDDSSDPESGDEAMARLFSLYPYAGAGGMSLGEEAIRICRRLKQYTEAATAECDCENYMGTMLGQLGGERRRMEVIDEKGQAVLQRYFSSSPDLRRYKEVVSPLILVASTLSHRLCLERLHESITSHLILLRLLQSASTHMVRILGACSLAKFSEHVADEIKALEEAIAERSKRASELEGALAAIELNHVILQEKVPHVRKLFAGGELVDLFVGEKFRELLVDGKAHELVVDGEAPKLDLVPVVEEEYVSPRDAFQPTGVPFDNAALRGDCEALVKEISELSLRLADTGRSIVAKHNEEGCSKELNELKRHYIVTAFELVNLERVLRPMLYECATGLREALHQELDCGDMSLTLALYDVLPDHANLANISTALDNLLSLLALGSRAYTAVVIPIYILCSFCDISETFEPARKEMMLRAIDFEEEHEALTDAYECLPDSWGII